MALDRDLLRGLLEDCFLVDMYSLIGDVAQEDEERLGEVVPCNEFIVV